MSFDVLQYDREVPAWTTNQTPELRCPCYQRGGVVGFGTWTARLTGKGKPPSADYYGMSLVHVDALEGL